MAHRVGICANPHVMPARVGRSPVRYVPTRAVLDELRPASVRLICYDFASFETALRRVPPEVKVIALLNGETEGVVTHRDLHGNVTGYDNWTETVAAFVARFGQRVWAVECHNELDLLGVGPEIAARVAREASPILRAARIKCLLTSVAAGGWQDYISRAVALCGRDNLDGVCAHFYGRAALGYPRPGFYFGEVEDGIWVAHAAADGLPVWVTEQGVKLRDVGGEHAQAEYVRKCFELMDRIPEHVCPALCYFAWHDDVGSPGEQGESAFGLMAADGRKRPAWAAFAEESAARQEVTVPDPEPHPEFNIGAGFREAIARHGLTALGPERYFTDDMSVCPTDRALLWYVKATNEIRMQWWERA